MTKAKGNPGTFAVVLLALAAVVASPASAGAETLYALERNGVVFRTIDRLTAADLSTISTSVTGSWRGIAMDPVTGVMYASDTEDLYTLDLTTGLTNQIGLFGSVVIRDLTFDDLGELYGVSGAQGSNSRSLHRIDVASGNATFVVALNGDGGHGIAYDPQQPGTIYHLAKGVESGIFERIDLADNSVTPIGLSGDPIISQSLGLVYDPLDDVFRFFDAEGRYYTIARDGTVTATGNQNPEGYFGLAFDQETTRVILFRDGFESGDTASWSSSVP